LAGISPGEKPFCLTPNAALNNRSASFKLRLVFEVILRKQRAIALHDFFVQMNRRLLVRR
jgi:hypothetical protein